MADIALDLNVSYMTLSTVDMPRKAAELDA